MTITNLPTIEQRIIRKLLDGAIQRGWTTSVYDGEDWTVKHSTTYAEITAAIGTTDETRLRFRADGEKKGDVILIHGNLEDVISDTSDTPEITDLCTEAHERAGV